MRSAVVVALAFFGGVLGVQAADPEVRYACQAKCYAIDFEAGVVSRLGEVSVTGRKRSLAWRRLQRRCEGKLVSSIYFRRVSENSSSSYPRYWWERSRASEIFDAEKYTDENTGGSIHTEHTSSETWSSRRRFYRLYMHDGFVAHFRYASEQDGETCWKEEIDTEIACDGWEPCRFIP